MAKRSKGGFNVEITGEIEDKDLGFGNVVKLMNFLGGKQRSVSVGLPDGTDPEVLMRGVINEYGAPLQKIPSRPWFSATVDANAKRYLDIMSDRFWKAYRNPDAKKTGNDIRAEVAQAIVDDLQTSILDKKWWPSKASTTEALHNAEKTKAKKGFDHPLIETGELHDAIRYEMDDD